MNLKMGSLKREMKKRFILSFICPFNAFSLNDRITRRKKTLNKQRFRTEMILNWRRSLIPMRKFPTQKTTIKMRICSFKNMAAGVKWFVCLISSCSWMTVRPPRGGL